MRHRDSDPLLHPFLHLLLLALCLYVAVRATVYRFQHPEKTETELFLEAPEWLW